MTLTLETDRLLIRDWEEDDAEAAQEIYGSADVAQWLSPAIEKVTDAATMRVILQAWIEAQPNFVVPAGRFAVVRKDDNEVIGGMLIRLLPPYEEDLEIGWQLRPSAWGNGFATEASKALMGWAFQTHASTSSSRSPGRTTSARSGRPAARDGMGRRDRQVLRPQSAGLPDAGGRLQTLIGPQTQQLAQAQVALAEQEAQPGQHEAGPDQVLGQRPLASFRVQNWCGPTTKTARTAIVAASIHLLCRADLISSSEAGAIQTQ